MGSLNSMRESSQVIARRIGVGFLKPEASITSSHRTEDRRGLFALDALISQVDTTRLGVGSLKSMHQLPQVIARRISAGHVCSPRPL